MGGRPQPEPDALTQPFWDAARLGRLALQRCRTCDAVVFPPLTHCPGCRVPALRWVAHPMEGIVCSWARTHAPVVEGIEPPYTNVSVEMEGTGGVRLSGFLAGAEPAIGTRVRLEFVMVDGTPTPTFSPCSNGAGPS